MEKHMLRVATTLTTSLHQCENGVTLRYPYTGQEQWTLPLEQSAGDEEEMEAHLRFLTMDLEMENLDLESCYPSGEDTHGEGGINTPRLSLRAELAKARRGKLAQNVKRSSSESGLQETPLKLKDVAFVHTSKDGSAGPSPVETSSEPAEYVLSSADRMQMDSLLLPEPFEPGEEEMLIRDRDLSCHAEPFSKEEEEEEENPSPEAEHVSRLKRKLSPSQAEQVPDKRRKGESQPAETLMETPDTLNSKVDGKETDEAEALKIKLEEKLEDSATDSSGGRLRNGESESMSAVKSVYQPPKRRTYKTESNKDNDEIQGSTVVTTETERDSDASAECGNKGNNSRVADDDTDPPKVLKIKQAGKLRVKRKPETRASRKKVNVKNATVESGTAGEAKEHSEAKAPSGASDQRPEVIEIDDSPSPSYRKQKVSVIARKPVTRSDRTKRTNGTGAQALAKVDAQGTIRARTRVTGKKRVKLDMSSDGEVATSSGETKNSGPVRSSEEAPGALRRAEEGNTMRDDTQVVVTAVQTAPVMKGLKRIQRKRGVYVGETIV